MSDKLIIQTQISGQKVEAQFIGSIDEDANFEKLTGLNMTEYIFDFAQVKLMNSCGREWIKFLELLPSASKTIYKNCRQIIVEQMNMVQGFIRENSQIESFYAPYYCEECDKESQVLLKMSDVKDRKAPKSLCPTHQCPMEFDAIEQQYFNFICSK